MRKITSLILALLIFTVSFALVGCVKNKPEPDDLETQEEIEYWEPEQDSSTTSVLDDNFQIPDEPPMEVSP